MCILQAKNIYSNTLWPPRNEQHFNSTMKQVEGMAHKCIFKYIQTEFKAKNFVSEIRRKVAQFLPYSFSCFHLVSNIHRIRQTKLELKEITERKLINLKFCVQIFFANLFKSCQLNCIGGNLSRQRTEAEKSDSMYKKPFASTTPRMKYPVKLFSNINGRHMPKKLYKNSLYKNQQNYTQLYRKFICKLNILKMRNSTDSTNSQFYLKYQDDEMQNMKILRYGEQSDYYDDSDQEGVDDSLIFNKDYFLSQKYNEDLQFLNDETSSSSSSDDDADYDDFDDDDDDDDDDDIIIFKCDLSDSTLRKCDNCIDVLFIESSVPNSFNDFTIHRITPKKVTFSDHVDYLPLDCSWSAEDQKAARDGSLWMQMAVDRSRFHQRIQNTSQQISWVFKLEHRQNFIRTM